MTLFQKSLRGRAKALVMYILPYITWNEKGEVTLFGQRNSNIVDLLKVQLREYKDFRPTGLVEFDRLLSNINVPHNLLAASRRKQTGDSSIPPPPGIPQKRKRDRSQERRSMKWLRLRNTKIT